MLTNQQISKNYQEAMTLAISLARKSYGFSGTEYSSRQDQIDELAQTVVGSVEVVELIRTKLFQPDYYRPALRTAIDHWKKELFPDVRKRQFLSIDAYQFELPAPVLPSGSGEEERAQEGINRNVKTILNGLSEENRNFLLQVIRNTQIPQRQEIIQSLGLQNDSCSPMGFKMIDRQIDRLRPFYPNGILTDTSGLDGRQPMTKSQITACFKNVYFGIQRRFPPNFLKRDGRERAAIMTRYLLDTILKTTPEQVLQKNDELFFIEHNLQCVYRLFNYSTNRALHNAYPDAVPPWLCSRSFENYWLHKKNRMAAVRWLAGSQLQIKPADIYRATITRSDFARHGLSFLFNQYYNSVSKALLEAYPELQPWEAGPVPSAFWTAENAACAMRWMIQKAGWTPDQLPELYRQKILTRKTFSHFSLATMFEKQFGKNIFRAIDCAYPGKFEPWQFGNVASTHWHNPDHIVRALRWLVGREGINPRQILTAIRSGRLNFELLKKYSIGTALQKLADGKIERLFAPVLWQCQEWEAGEQRVIGKLKTLIRREKERRHFGFYLVYGFFVPAVQLAADDYVFRYERMLRRIKRRSRRDVMI